MLRDFLREIAGRACVLGTHDCGLMLADWVERITGRDPAAPVRGRYSTQEELAALSGPFGLPRLFDRLLRTGGLVRTMMPTIGDVAIIAVANEQPRGAIYGRHGFAIIAQGGISRVPHEGVRLIMAWTLP